MPILSRGAAWLDGTGALVVADPGFRRALGLPDDGTAGALAARAAVEASLGALVAGAGPDRLAVAGPGGAPLLLERWPGAGGRLLLLRAEGDEARLEQAECAVALPALAGGLFHDVNGALNTMGLQLALLGDQVGEGGATRHLERLRAQAGRIARLVRGFREAVDPDRAGGGLDLAARVAEVAGLFAHDLQVRGIQLAIAPAAGPVRCEADPVRVTRLLVGLLGRVAAATPEGGSLAAEVAVVEGRATLTLRHGGAAGGVTPGYDIEVEACAAAAMGGALGYLPGAGGWLVTLQLPKGANA